LIDDDFRIDFELSLFVSNMKGKFVVVWFFFLLKEIWRKKTHSTLSLMLTPRFKSLV
jgi:hypothetical protein